MSEPLAGARWRSRFSGQTFAVAEVYRVCGQVCAVLVVDGDLEYVLGVKRDGRICGYEEVRP